MPQNAKLQSRHLLGLQHVPAEDIQLILHWAGHFKEVINRPIKRVPSLRDLTVANLFFENSTRTRLSFELAEKRLSADVVNFSASTSSVKKGETLNDTVNNILAMKVDLVVIRHSEAGVAHFLADRVPAHIVNAGDGTHEHPTQALLDAFTMQERIGSLEGKKVVIVGDILHSRVALSNIFGLQKLGVHVAVSGPSTLIPRAISELGVEVIDHLDDALEWAATQAGHRDDVTTRSELGAERDQ
jgi:aspartate carbamoyltransferase catalytic subunit